MRDRLSVLSPDKGEDPERPAEVEGPELLSLGCRQEIVSTENKVGVGKRGSGGRGRQRK